MEDGASYGSCGAGGGSSYISGHNGCIAVTEDGTPLTQTYSNITNSYSYTNFVFTNTKMIDGQGYEWTTQRLTQIGMPDFLSENTITGNTGNGYCVITYSK